MTLAPAMTPISAKTGRYVDETSREDQRTYAIFTHLIGLASLLDLFLAGLIGTVVMWQIKARESDFLDDHGREAVNFQLSLLLYSIASFGVLIPVVFVLRLIGCIRGAIAASRGEYYRYPMCIRFITEPAEPLPG
jgi:uncharacterized Tic20 family protein